MRQGWINDAPANARSACIAGGLIEATGGRTRCRRRRARVPPVLQAASLKPPALPRHPRSALARSACIAGGLIEARGPCSAPSPSRSPRSACIAGGLIEATWAAPDPIAWPARSACIAGGLIEATARPGGWPPATGVPPVLQAASLKLHVDDQFRRRVRCVPPVLQAASLKQRLRRIPGQGDARVPPVLQAASLKPPEHLLSLPDVQRVPPVLQAASLKPDADDHADVAAPPRSACIAGGLIEAAWRGSRSTCRTSVPPVLQAASLKPPDRHHGTARRGRRSACIAGGLIEALLAGGEGLDLDEAFRLYCRRPH